MFNFETNKKYTEASLILTKEFPHDDSIKDEDIMYSYCTYIAENAETLNLVEGEKVFVLGKLTRNVQTSIFKTCVILIQLILFSNTEKHNEDWWFVKKPLTSEKGWVPSQCLMDVDSYKQYVDSKLNEKIDKLPVFASK